MATEAQEHRKIEQLHERVADDLEIAAGREREQLEGWMPELATEDEVRDALEKAFDYRGDITLTRRDGTTVEGYVFDRQTGGSLIDSFVRVIPSKERAKLRIAYADIVRVHFSGRDTAAGKSFEAWMKRYHEKKAAGEKDIRIDPERLD